MVDYKAKSFKTVLRQNKISLIAGLALSSSLLINVAHAQEFKEALSLTYETNPTLNAARSAARATDEQVPQALANWRPTVQLQADATRQHLSVNKNNKALGAAGIDNAAKSTDADTIVNLTANLNQAIYRGGRTISATETAEQNVLVARQQLRDTEQDVLLGAVQAYTNVYRDIKLLELQNENEDILEKQLEAAQDRFDVGEITKTDVAQAESRLAAANADRVQAEGNLETSRATFAQIIGQNPADLEEPTILIELPRTLHQTMNIAERNNPDILAASHNYLSADSQIEEARGFLRPEVNLQAAFNRNFPTFDRSDQQLGNVISTDTANIQLQLRVPLYQQGLRYSQVRQTKETKGQRRLQILEQRRNVLQQTKQGWEALVATRETINAFNTQIKAAQIAFEGASQEALVGSRTVLDVLDTQAELIDAKINLVNAENNEIVAAYQVIQGMGRLSAKELDLPVALYDPTDHYNEVRDRWFGTGEDNSLKHKRAPHDLGFVEGK